MENCLQVMRNTRSNPNVCRYVIYFDIAYFYGKKTMGPVRLPVNDLKLSIFSYTKLSYDF